MKKLKQHIKKYRERFTQESVVVSLYFFRIILAIVVMITLFTPKRNLSLLLFIVAIALGFFEYKRYKKVTPTQFESLLDTLADKLLVDLSAIALYITNILPLWVLIVFLAKDILFVLRGALTLRKEKYTVFKQTPISRITLFFQVIAIVAILFDKMDTFLIC